MIWSAGRLMGDDELSIPCADRVFEHGLGLFESFRTWNRQARLLPRHLDRLSRSARQLDLPLDPAMLPRADDVAALLDALGALGDARFRIVLTGGLSAHHGSSLWMRASMLDVGTELEPSRVRASWTLAAPPLLDQHKTLNYWRKRQLQEAATRDGFDEDLGADTLGGLLEGTRSNLFAVVGRILWTPAATGSILPGVFRELVLELAPNLGLEVRQTPAGLSVELCSRATEVFLTNSVRGIMPVASITLVPPREGGTLRFPSTPGPWSRRLIESTRAWLEHREDGRR